MKSKAIASGNREENRERSLANLKPYPPGFSGNPSGRPKRDKAADIAQAIFEGEPEQILIAMAKALKKGNPKVFTALADRAYGKPQETVNINVRDVGAEERIRELLARADSRRAALPQE